MTKEEVDKLGGTNHITERGHSYHYTLGPIVELPATGDYDKLWAISIKSDDLEDIRKSYGLETSPQLGFYIPVGCKKKRVTEDNEVSKLAEATKEADAAITPSNFKDYSKPAAPAQPTTYNKGSYPTAQPGPNYERGDSARGGWSSIPGWLEKNRPLPEEAPLSGASSDLAMLTPAGRIMSGIKSLASTPAAAKAIKNPERNKSAAYMVFLSVFNASINPIPKDLSWL